MTDTIRFDVEGMTCASCALRIERVLGKQDGVDAAVVNFAGQEARATVGSDADIVVWDPAATKTISTKTDHQNVDYNIFEGMEVTGCASHTISQGKVVYADGKLDVERGAGRYIDRPPFAPYYDALNRQLDLAEPVAVKR